MAKNEVLDGTDLILSVDGMALAYAKSCKITTSTETGQRITKEASSGKWTEKYAKSFSEDISADGCQPLESATDIPAYDLLKQKQLAGEPVEASYARREGTTREGSKKNGYKGTYLITSLELDGPAGDDTTYSVKLESTGPVTPIGGGISDKGGAA